MLILRRIDRWLTDIQLLNLYKMLRVNPENYNHPRPLFQGHCEAHEIQELSQSLQIAFMLRRLTLMESLWKLKRLLEFEKLCLVWSSFAPRE